MHCGRERPKPIARSCPAATHKKLLLSRGLQWLVRTLLVLMDVWTLYLLAGATVD